MPFLVGFDRVIPFVLYVKGGGGSNSADDTLGNIPSFLTVIDVTGADVLEAYSLHADDFEDCLPGVCANKSGISRIITRDKTGFGSCEIPFCRVEDYDQ